MQTWVRLQHGSVQNPAYIVHMAAGGVPPQTPARLVAAWGSLHSQDRHLTDLCLFQWKQN